MPACLSCGAALRADDTRCPLCGTPAGASDPDAPETPEADLAVADLPVADLPSRRADDRPVAGVCATCGHANPAGARYCNACGASLAETARLEAASAVEGVPVGALPEPAGPSERPSSAAGRQALLLMGGGALVVALLYGVTVWTQRQPAAPAAAPEPAAVGAAPAIPDGPAPPLPDTLQAAADRQAALGTPGGLYESGRYYLTAAFEATDTNPTASAQWARKARDEFQRSLDLREDPDVRLALAESLRFDPSAPPMQPIQEVQRVLTVAPDHPGANYLMGDLRLMRAQFQPEWADSARVSFERVVAVAPPGSDLHGRAQRALAMLAGGTPDSN